MSPNCVLFVEKLNALEEVDSDDQLSYKLSEICDLLADTPDSSSIIPYIFSFFEAHPNADFGLPGPFVHFLESRPDYEAHLLSSLDRKPVVPTVLMVNRILNTSLSTDRREKLIDLLRSIGANPQADEEARNKAIHFLAYQAKRKPA